jgi:uncharacterized protein
MPLPEFHRMTFEGQASLAPGGDEGKPPTIVGYAAVFNQTATIIDGKHKVLRETVRPGAFARALADGADVRALVNHSPGTILGRSKSGTLRMEEDAHGLKVTIEPPDTQAARDVMRLIERGDVTGMSFAARMRPNGSRSASDKDEMGRSVEHVELLDLDLKDVSVVTFPAYEGTSVALRAAGFDPAEVAAWDVPEQRAEPEPDPPAPAPLREAFRRHLAATTNPATSGQECDHDRG